MADMLQTIFHRLLTSLDIDTRRYLYPSFRLDNRLIGLAGPRGVGKTTMLLQFIRETQDISSVLYFSADNIFFSSNSLFDYVCHLYETEGIRVFFIDEAHKYKSWSQELKNIYDSFPDVTIVFSGSSSMDLVKGAYDLSRRGVMHHLYGLSFREYLNFSTGQKYPVVDFATLVADRRRLSAELASIPRLKGYFKEYLQLGYYPFVFESGNSHYEKLANVIEKTVHEDIASYYSLKTTNLHFFKQILHYLCTTPPGRVNAYNLAKTLGLDSKTALHYLLILQETGLVRLIYSDKKGSALIRKPVKVFVDNTTLLYMINETLGLDVNVGTARELFFLSMVQNSGEKVFYSNDGGDYCCQDIVFEIGGRGKGRKQIKGISGHQAFLVKDDILHASAETIPLWLFGFLY